MSLRIAARTDFEILKECEEWLIVDKPAPLIMHPTGKSDEVTLLGVGVVGGGVGLVGGGVGSVLVVG